MTTNVRGSARVLRAGLRFVPAMLVATVAACLGATPATRPAADASAIRTLFIAGDSTAAINSSTQMGWGIHFQDYFDPAKLKVVNGAQSGLSTRTFINNGAWQRIMSRVKPGDYVIIQFGHNDNGPVDSFRFRGTMPSLGDETQEAHNAQGQPETVHTFGWYMKKMIHEVQEKQAIPIVVSMTVRGEWKDGKVERGFGDYAKLAGEVAKAEGVRFVDLTDLVADKYEEMGPEKVKALFPRDTTHTSLEGGKLNAESVLAGLKALHEEGISGALSEKGKEIAAGPEKYVVMAKPAGAAH